MKAHIASHKKIGISQKSENSLPVIPANSGSGPGQAPESSVFGWLKIIWAPVITGVKTFHDPIKVTRLRSRDSRLAEF